MSEIQPQDAAREFAHPLRAPILAMLDGREGCARTLAAELGAPVEAVACQLTILRELGAIEPTCQWTDRPAQERGYVAAWRVTIDVREIDA